MKLSIITTVYQAEKDLPRLLDSMMTNKSSELEFLLIDNGSTDESANICAEYSKQDSRFKIHTLKENIGYIRARNLGISIVKADYIGFCDSDDFIENGAYDNIIGKLKKYDCDLIIGGWNTIINRHVIRNIPPFRCEYYSSKADLEKLMSQFFGPTDKLPMVRGFMWKQFFRLSLLRENGLRFRENMKPYEDMFLNAQYFKVCESILVTDDIIYNYIVNPKSITVKQISDLNIEEEGTRISELILSLRKEAENEACITATANQGLIMLGTMISLASKKHLSPNQIKDKIYESISVDLIKYIAQFSSPHKISYRWLKWCLSHDMLTSFIWIVKKVQRYRGS